MVKEEIKKDKTYYQGTICEFYYETKGLAQQCEDFCEGHHACNIDITKKAVTFEEE